ncbi:MAG: hypothetical protein GYA20_04730 [Chloroflexi bacterium]|nr:hypothetical protein [Chloroflexota bacterium]
MIRRKETHPVISLVLLFCISATLWLFRQPSRVDGFAAGGPFPLAGAIAQQKVVAPDGAAKTGFGQSAAISDDGSTALIGTYYTEFGIQYPIGPGKVYAFIKDGSIWSFQQQLPTPPMPDADLFGFSVALSADGNTALVGAQGGTGPAETQVPGAAYVFIRKNGTWEQQAILTAADREVGDHFGISVALSDDGNTALVGAYVDDVGANLNQGSVYIFKRSGVSWNQQAQLTASDGAAEDYFGRSVSLAADGATALIGADFKRIGENNRQGAAYVFTENEGAWSQQARITAQEGSMYNWFGFSVGLSSDGRTALVGAEGYGAAFVFTLSGNTWSEQAVLNVEGITFFWGVPVALSPDGHTALIEDGYLFQYIDDNWQAGPNLQPEDSGTASNGFGSSVALSKDGSLALVGAKFAQIGENQSQGAAYFFSGFSALRQPAIFLPLVIR